MPRVTAMISRWRRKATQGFMRRLFPDRLIVREVRETYDGIAQSAPQRHIAFMNQGYASLDPQEPVPELCPEDREFQYHVNLLDQVYRHVDCAGREVLEAGCGRGGGVYYCARYLKAGKVTGVDLSPMNVARARETFPLPNVEFMEANAMDLPFEAESFDIVVNIESSHLYPDAPRFFRQANNILRPDGFFLFVDLGSVERIKGLPEAFRKAGFGVVMSSDITRNVMESIRRDMDRRAGFLKNVAESESDFRGLCEWARLPGTEGFNRYSRGDDQYWAYVLRKTQASSSERQ